MNRWMTLDKAVGGRFTWLIRIEPAVDGVAACDEWLQPWEIGSNSGRRDAETWSVKFHRMQLKAADGIDGRFAENDAFGTSLADPEVTEVLASAGRQPTPCSLAGATQLGSDGMIVFSGDHQKDSVATLVSV